MGGSLQHPAERFPSYFSNPFWETYPYFLPCAVSAAYAAFAFIIIFVFFEEVRGPLDPLPYSLPNTILSRARTC